MAGGAFLALAGGRQDYPGELTLFVSMACLVAATGGLLFGYGIGVSGGVTSMDPFLIRFFSSVYRKQAEAAVDQGGNQYCMFDSQLLTTFTSSIFLSALVASLLAGTFTRVAGRKWSIFVVGLTFLAGSAINAAAVNVLMLLCVGVGFASQSAPLYLSEMAPARLWGMLNNGFNLMITVGILLATIVNYGTQKIASGWGWRVSLALAAVPAGIIVVGSFFLHDTPNSLLERGRPEDSARMLRRARGVDDVSDEFRDLVEASKASRAVTRHPAAPVPPAAGDGGGHPGVPAAHQHRAADVRDGAVQDDGIRRQRVAHVRSDHRHGQPPGDLRVGVHRRPGRRRALLLEGGLQMLVSMVAMSGLVMGPAGMTGAERGDAAGGADRGAEHHGGDQHVHELRNHAGVPAALLPPRVHALLRLRRPARCHDPLCRTVPAGDQGGCPSRTWSPSGRSIGTGGASSSPMTVRKEEKMSREGRHQGLAGKCNHQVSMSLDHLQPLCKKNSEFLKTNEE
jgi:hypothetical protein